MTPDGHDDEADGTGKGANFAGAARGAGPASKEDEDDLSDGHLRVQSLGQLFGMMHAGEWPRSAGVRVRGTHKRKPEAQATVTAADKRQRFLGESLSLNSIPEDEETCRFLEEELGVADGSPCRSDSSSPFEDFPRDVTADMGLWAEQYRGIESQSVFAAWGSRAPSEVTVPGIALTLTTAAGTGTGGAGAGAATVIAVSSPATAADHAFHAPILSLAQASSSSHQP